MVHDISKYIKNCEYHLYADDTLIYKRSTIKKIHQTINRIEEDLKSIKKYSKDNCLRINTDKSSNFIIIGSKKQTNDLKVDKNIGIKIDGEPLQQEEKTKYLGLVFDHNFTWEAQINQMVKKAYHKLRIFYRFKNLLSIKTKTRLVETYVLSILNYGDIIIQGVKQELRTKLQRVQNSCIRFIYNLKKYDHITPFLKEAQTLNIGNRTRLHGIVQMHRIVKGESPAYLTEKIIYRSDIHSFNTRSKNLIQTKKLKKCIKNGAFFQKTTNDYNQLINKNIINFNMSVFSVKANVKKQLLTEQNCS